MSSISSLVSTDPRTDYWQHHVTCCQHSGQSKAQYCRDHELTYHLFIYWSTKLGKADASSADLPGASCGKLVPVALASNPGLSSSSGLHLHLPNGVYISGIDSQSVALIGQLIDQL